MVYHEVVSALPHKLRVMRMYRYGLRELLNWSSSRRVGAMRMHLALPCMHIWSYSNLCFEGAEPGAPFCDAGTTGTAVRPRYARNLR